MSLEHIEAGIKEVRAKADPVRSRYDREVRNIQSDPNLSEEGKRAQIKDVAADYKSRLVALRDSETAIITSEVDRLERLVASTVGTTGSDIIAYRDAQDRAERIQDANQASQMMARALRNGDKTLAHAVFGRAIDAGYREAAQMYTELHPSLRDVASDLNALKHAQTSTMERNLFYGTASWTA